MAKQTKPVEEQIEEQEQTISEQDQQDVKIVYPVPGATDQDAINPAPEKEEKANEPAQ